MFDELEKNYLVPDLVPESCSFLFILESPHVKELQHVVPVSGTSGLLMAKHLYGDQFGKEALGVLIKKNRDLGLKRPELNKVGLMNVCRIPMQAAAYGDPQVIAQYGEFLHVLEGLRSANNKMSYAKSEWNAVQERIVKDLRGRLERFREHSLHIVPCGRFAQKFFRLADVRSPKWHVIEGVPHPSYNGWSKSEYAAAVQSLLNAFARS